MLTTRYAVMLFLACWFNGFQMSAVAEENAANAQAIFAGGCFWCMEQPFDELPGVLQTIPGYTGGTVKNPTYEQVSSGVTGHFEAIKIIYNPSQISYAKLLDIYWRNIDPTDDTGQFCDKGDQYRSAIFYQNEQQKQLAEQSIAALKQHKTFSEPVLTLLLPGEEFFPAEEYHHDYYHENPIRYKFYRYTCGRDKRLKALWGKQ